MAATHISPFPTMIYGALQLCCAISFSLLAAVIDLQQERDAAWRKAQQVGIWKGRLSQALYVLAIPAAYFKPAVSIAIFVVIGLIYTVPDLLARSPTGKSR